MFRKHCRPHRLRSLYNFQAANKPYCEYIYCRQGRNSTLRIVYIRAPAKNLCLLSINHLQNQSRNVFCRNKFLFPKEFVLQPSKNTVKYGKVYKSESLQDRAKTYLQFVLGERKSYRLKNCVSIRKILRKGHCGRHRRNFVCRRLLKHGRPMIVFRRKDDSGRQNPYCLTGPD